MDSFTRESDISIFAKADPRGSNTAFGIKQADRRGHMYIIGKTGTGKSTVPETLMIDDLRKGKGFAVLDPHGDLLKRIRSQLPVKSTFPALRRCAAGPTSLLTL